MFSEPRLYYSPEFPSRGLRKIVAMIPARFAATRFPGKLMQLLGELPVITHTWKAVQESDLFHEVIVVTDSEIIREEIENRGGKTFFSQQPHESGSDRIAEAARSIDADIIINVQGDEPFIDQNSLKVLTALFEDPHVKVASLMRPLKSDEDAGNPNMVKLVVNKQGDALYFSRSAIPFRRDIAEVLPTWVHLGVYGFTKETLLAFTSWPMGILEKVEKLEQLRYLENGIPIRMGQVAEATQAIDAPEDLEKARAMLQNR